MIKAFSQLGIEKYLRECRQQFKMKNMIGTLRNMIDLMRCRRDDLGQQ